MASIQMVITRSYIKTLRFTFPSTTQQSLIIYRVGELSVASTIISYLRNSHDQKKHTDSVVIICKREMNINIEESQASRKKKKKIDLIRERKNTC